MRVCDEAQGVRGILSHATVHGAMLRGLLSHGAALRHAA